jgi:hypothetical protein
VASQRASAGQEIEQDRPVLEGVDRDHLPTPVGVGMTMEDLEVGRLPSERRSVVD